MNDVVFFYAGWEPLVRIVVLGVLMLVTLVVFLRLSGSRTLASMNAFDFIITVAIGSVFARALTAKEISLAEAVTAFAFLIGLQFIIAWLQTRVASFKSYVTNPPVLLYYRGEFLGEAMKRQRVTEDEVRSAARKKQLGSLDDVEAIVLETDGEFSIVKRMGDGSAMGGVLSDQIAAHNQDIP